MSQEDSSTGNTKDLTNDIKLRTDRPVVIEIDENGVIHGWCDNAYLFFTGREDKVRENMKNNPYGDGEELCG